MTTSTAGLTSTEHMPYGYRRWNGVVWADCQINEYNHQLDRIQVRAQAGYDVTALVDGLYNLADSFDNLDR